MDVGVALQWQEVDVVMDNLLSLRHHLRLTYPQCCCGYGDGEVIDFYAVKLMDIYLNGILEDVELLYAVYLLDNLVL